MGNKILLSICIPTYNGAEYLDETIGTLVSQVDELDVEDCIKILVCDNASVDSTPEIIRAWGARRPDLIRCVRAYNNEGFNANIDRAIANSRGEYLHFLGDDDLYCPRCLERLLNVIRLEGHAIVVLSNSWLNGDQIIPRATQDGYFPHGCTISSLKEFVQIAWYRCWAVSNVVIRRSSVIRCCPSSVQDWRHLDLVLETMALTKDAYCMPEDEPCILIRIGNQQWMGSKRHGDIYENCARSLHVARKFGYGNLIRRFAWRFFINVANPKNPLFWGDHKFLRILRYWRMMWLGTQFYTILVPRFFYLIMRPHMDAQPPTKKYNISKDDLEIMVISYNRAKFLEEQLQSLCAQTIKGLNIRIIDNASTDETLETVGKIKSQHQEHSITFEQANCHFESNAESFRRTQRLATRKYVAVFHDDDIVHPCYIENVLKVINRHPEAVGISCSEEVLYDCSLGNWRVESSSFWVYPRACAPYWYLSNQRFCFAAMVYKTDIYKELPIDPQSYGKLFDNIMLLKLCTKGIIIKLKGKFIRYRLHEGSDSSNIKTMPRASQVYNVVKDAQECLAGSSKIFFTNYHLYEYAKLLFEWSLIRTCTWSAFAVNCAYTGVLPQWVVTSKTLRNIVRHFAKRHDKHELRKMLFK